ncbi:exopolysaccharide biosynthesis protein [Pseudobdellovibrio exovorus]|uniref:Exopolysaccharide biosynthesis protein n=1 Tax=Pseudobdellovibrio exovorus JSS TaxID=1184267 RepID=M4VRX9_9BACT|nr:exopolysaccharide biosynthesis protein [Pseudobdellovibrio exovorus]AGH95939.1 hypothetical protein A11Q_1723 [Pseudobdellovibrio exovorus JSS]
MKTHKSPLIAHLTELEKKAAHQEITLKDVVTIFGTDGHFVLILFCILPFLQPIPLMGLSTPFGLLISLVAFFYYLQKPPYLPKRWQNKTINHTTLLKIAEGAEKFFKKLERFIKPRLEFLFSEPFKSINIIFIILNAILLALPLPIPFSNAIPAWVILLQAIGHLERDGVLVLISYIQAVLSLIFFTTLAYGLKTGIEFIDNSMPTVAAI